MHTQLGTFNTIKATLPELKKTHGSIIAVSAVLQQGATVLQAHAASAKAGVDTLIRHVALEYGPFGVRANTIARACCPRLAFSRIRC